MRLYPSPDGIRQEHCRLSRGRIRREETVAATADRGVCTSPVLPVYFGGGMAILIAVISQQRRVSTRNRAFTPSSFLHGSQWPRPKMLLCSFLPAASWLRQPQPAATIPTARWQMEHHQILSLVWIRIRVIPSLRAAVLRTNASPMVYVKGLVC